MKTFLIILLLLPIQSYAWIKCEVTSQNIGAYKNQSIGIVSKNAYQIMNESNSNQNYTLTYSICVTGKGCSKDGKIVNVNPDNKSFDEAITFSVPVVFKNSGNHEFSVSVDINGNSGTQTSCHDEKFYNVNVY